MVFLSDVVLGFGLGYVLQSPERPALDGPCMPGSVIPFFGRSFVLEYLDLLGSSEPRSAQLVLMPAPAQVTSSSKREFVGHPSGKLR